MITVDKRFFELEGAVYNRKSGGLVINFACWDNFTPEIPRLEKHITMQVRDNVGFEIPIEFNYNTPPASQAPLLNKRGILGPALDELRKHAETVSQNGPKAGVDKVLPISNMEYLCGMPIKIRPIRIKYLRVSPEEQVTAGTMHFLTKREYTKNDITKSYWTFALNDGESALQCVFFPSQKSGPKFEILKNNTTICVQGVHDKRNDRTSFRVTGVSFCDL